MMGKRAALEFGLSGAHKYMLLALFDTFQEFIAISAQQILIQRRVQITEKLYHTSSVSLITQRETIALNLQ